MAFTKVLWREIGLSEVLPARVSARRRSSEFNFTQVAVANPARVPDDFVRLNAAVASPSVWAGAHHAHFFPGMTPFDSGGSSHPERSASPARAGDASAPPRGAEWPRASQLESDHLGSAAPFSSVFFVLQLAPAVAVDDGGGLGLEPDVEGVGMLDTFLASLDLAEPLPESDDNGETGRFVCYKEDGLSSKLIQPRKHRLARNFTVQQ